MGDDPLLAQRVYSMWTAVGGVRRRAVARHAFRRQLGVRLLMGSAVADFALQTSMSPSRRIVRAGAHAKRGVDCLADLSIGFKRAVETDLPVVAKRRSRMTTLAQGRCHPGSA